MIQMTFEQITQEVGALFLENRGLMRELVRLNELLGDQLRDEQKYPVEEPEQEGK